jgi:single-strand DNA-binding protein
VATESSWKDKNSGEWKKQTEWVRVVAWGKPWISDSLKKGDLVFVMGRTQTRDYESGGVKKQSTELVADDVKNLTVMVIGKNRDGAAAGGGAGKDPWD